MHGDDVFTIGRAELLTARGLVVTHLLGPGRQEPHRLFEESEIRADRLYLCGQLVGLGSYSRVKTFN
jgi:hypothetical protein